MFERFTEAARSVVRLGQAEAYAAGSPRVEAEQLLLAITTQTGTPAERALSDAGLDHERLLEALRSERERSLAFAGVTPPPPGPTATAGLRAVPSLRFGTSAKTVLEHTVVSAKARAKGSIETTDILRGILQMQAGTVPRALALAGIDRSALLARLQEDGL